MTSPDLDRWDLVLEDGFSCDLWTDGTVSDTFLDPCQTMSMSLGTDETRFGLMGRLRRGSPFKIEINGIPVIGGFLDCTQLSADRGGTKLTVTGRDVLSPVVDSNVDPRLPVKKGMSLLDLSKLLFEQHFLLPIKVSAEDADVIGARNKALGKPVSAKPKKGRKKPTDQLKEIYPKPNEGGFQYFVRFAHRVGYHAWAQPDGQGIVLGAPTYEQEPAGDLVLLRGDFGTGNNILKSSIKSDNTRVPSHVYVRGKGSKPGDKSNVLGWAVNPDAPYFKPFYLTDDESATKDHADALARFTLGKALREAFCYEVTVRGNTSSSGRLYCVDTLLRVRDEACGVEGEMWVEKRTFRKSRSGGTTTDLTLIPAESLLLDYYVSDSPPPPETYAAAGAGMAGGGLSAVDRKYSAPWFQKVIDKIKASA